MDAYPAEKVANYYNNRSITMSYRRIIVYNLFVIITLLVPTYSEINICSKREISGNASQIPRLMKKFTEVVSKNFCFFLRGETLVFLPEDCHWPLLLKSSFYLGAVR